MAKGNSLFGLIQMMEGAGGSLRNPEIVLNNLASKSSKQHYVYERMYHYLYNPAFYLMAYSNLTNKKAKPEKQRNEKSIEAVISQLIGRLRDESYHPIARDKLCFQATDQDVLLLEVVRLLLDAMYENEFFPASHGFRENRNCHTALTYVQQHFAETTWFISGELESIYFGMNNHILIKILERRIRDMKFIRLIWKLLKAGYAGDWTYHKTYSGTPIGGFLSPIFANIYLHEFDQFISNYQEKHLKLSYCRYADAFLIGVTGSKKDCLAVKSAVSNFLSQHLKLPLSEKIGQITHNKEKVRFLGYDIAITKVNSGGLRKCALFVPYEKWLKLLLEYHALKIEKDGTWKAVHRTYLKDCNDVDIFRIYNAEMSALFNYYQLAENVSSLQSFSHFMKYSLCKTFANKYKSTVRKMLKKYHVNGRLAIKNDSEIIYFFHNGTNRKASIFANMEVDRRPETLSKKGRMRLLKK
ncbi:hypothetical protein J9303_08450 [Bacillaceae bacterium Marseille-Q3522]|nr:hypothetical protein [Bacillaceae bacterium Marseille-Q3522]